MGRISDQPQADLPLSGDEQLVIVQNGVTKHVELEDAQPLLSENGITRQDVIDARDEVVNIQSNIEQITGNFSGYSGAFLESRTDPVEVIIYDRRLDTDGGSYWNKIDGKSWQTINISQGRYLGEHGGNVVAQQANPDWQAGDYYYFHAGNQFLEFSADGTSFESTRFGKKDFPLQSIIVAYDTFILILDNDGTTPTPWMNFRARVGSSTNNSFWLGQRAIESIDIKNGVLVAGVGTTNGTFNGEGVLIWDFVSDEKLKIKDSVGSFRGLPVASDNNLDLNLLMFNLNNFLLSNIVHDVKLFDAVDNPKDLYGRKIPTLYINTEAEVAEVIFGIDIKNPSVFYKVLHSDLFSAIEITDDFILGSSNSAISVFDRSISNNVSSNSRSYFLNGVSKPSINLGSLAAEALQFNKITNRLHTWTASNSFAGESIVRLSDTREGCITDVRTGFNLWPNNTNATVINISSSDQNDAIIPEGEVNQLVSNNIVNVVGNLSTVPVNTGCEYAGIGGFDQNNYLESVLPNPIGIGDFLVEMWIRDTDSQGGTEYFTIGDTSETSPTDSFHFYKQGVNNRLIFIDGGTFRGTSINLSNITTRHIVFRRVNRVIDIFVDGVKVDTRNSLSTLSNPNVRIGAGFFVGGLNAPADFMTFKMDVGDIRTTDADIREFYERTKPLFAENANCLLDGTFSVPNSVNRNNVRSADVDQITGDAWVGIQSQQNQRSIFKFRDLLRVSDFRPREFNIPWTSEFVDFITASDDNIAVMSNSDNSSGVGIINREINSSSDVKVPLFNKPSDKYLGKYSITTNEISSKRLYSRFMPNGSSIHLKATTSVFDNNGVMRASFVTTAIVSNSENGGQLPTLDYSNVETLFDDGGRSIGVSIDPETSKVLIFIITSGVTDLNKWETVVERVA